MDRLNQLRGEAGDSTLDTSSPPSEAFMSANESSSKYFSLSEVDSTFSISPSKDAPAGPADSGPERTITEDPAVIPNLSPIPKTDCETFKIGKHIEAANILSGGVNIFEDNDNSYDGDELVIDDNVDLEDEKADMKVGEGNGVLLEKHVTEDTLAEGLDEAEAIPSKDTEVVLQIDGKNVDAIDIGNGLYLYRKSGEKELSAVQIIDDDQQQPSFKFLKVRENTEGNLEVYEEIQIEIPKEVPPKNPSPTEKITHVPIKDINKVINEPSCNKVIEKINKAPKLESNFTTTMSSESLETYSESKSEVNLNGKMMKFNESRKSPLTFTPMTYHSTPNKEGIPLTKTMVDQQLHPSRHSDNIKKTIEVHTDNSNSKPKINEFSYKIKEFNETIKLQETRASILETEECNRTIVENNQKEAEIKNKNLDEEYLEIKTISEDKDCSRKSLKESSTIAEEKVKSKETLQDPKNLKREDIKYTNEGKTICPNLKITSELKEITESPKGQEDNQSMTKQASVEGNIDKINCKSLVRNKENDCVETKPESLTEENKTIENKEVALTTCTLIGHVTQQVSFEESKLTPTFKTTYAETVCESKSVQEIKKDDVVETSEGIGLHNRTIVDTNPSTITDEATRSNKVGGGGKDFNLIKDTVDEPNNFESKININEKVVSKIQDLQILTHSFKSGIESQIDNVICNKDTKDDPVKNKAKDALSLAPTKKDNVELQKLAKPVFQPSKFPSKESNITQRLMSKQFKQFDGKKGVSKINLTAKPILGDNSVPFGKWTDTNRQEFLIKIKETKIHSNCNPNQIKQTNDLNRRDVLKKFDSQRQSTISLATKIPDFRSAPKVSSKIETSAFVNKSATIAAKHIIPSLKTQAAPVRTKSVVTKEESLNSEEQIINSQELIDKTVEGIITRALKMKTTTPIHMKQQMTIHTVENPKDAMPLPGSLDYIEMKMNELHGFSFTDKPGLELSHAANHNIKSYSKFEDINTNKTDKIPNLLPFKATDQQTAVNVPARDDTSDEEIIEHEPITGDIDVSKQNLISLLSCKQKIVEPKKDTIITETDFDKFAGRNSITYENCLTVNFDGKEKHNVIQTLVEKETSVKKLTRNELLLAESKAKSSSKQSIAARHNQLSKIPILRSTTEDDGYNKSYHSKVQIAYQSALTAKRNLECPISIIEDKPVKVEFMESNTEYTPTQLNLQGQELSPCKKKVADSEVHSVLESLDSDILESVQDLKSLDEKSKTKHQRKQVLTPVEQEPEIQLIEPSDLGIKVSPTKKRRIEEKSDKHTKYVVPKKSYLLHRNVVDEHKINPELHKTELFMGHKPTALDNLVKAAELIENQSESNSANVACQSTEAPQNAPVKRGRGRPRKYPLPEPGSEANKSPSSQKKPRLIDAKPVKTYSDSDESSDGEIVKENWTMGKINENIVCPICSKLFRSEDVLFKHVKHCTGPSPSRSESDKRSPRRLRNSQESERKLRDSRSDIEDTEGENDDEEENIQHPIKALKPVIDSEDVIVIEDTPIKQKSNNEKTNHPEAKKIARKSKHPLNTDHVCEFCGKIFRQLSYLINHKLQHKKEDLKKTKKLESDNASKSVFSCEVCRKEFRKLHHLVQHRIIHNPSSMASRSLRKASSEVYSSDSKHSKMPGDDASAGFRCEPCDKSFRKLHHLVEHRETHDGINKKGNTSQTTNETSKTILAHHCDICKKVFKKLQDLLEHKEQHYDTSSEKSDDKSVKSSLSTKDIIHECSLCYMVFPNEHSLNKHTVICLRKKKQSAAKQAAKQAEMKEGKETPDEENLKTEEDMSQYKEDIHVTDDVDTKEETKTVSEPEDTDHDQQLTDATDKVVKQHLDDEKHDLDVKLSYDACPKKRHSNATNEKTNADNIETPAKIKKVEIKECVKIADMSTPKKKANKDKETLALIKKQSVNNPSPVIDNVHANKPKESSDEEEIRYMLNPNFKEEESIRSKMFNKIRALKRNSLQIERPNSKDLVKRRISLQQVPRVPRLKAKPLESKPRPDHERFKTQERSEKLTAVTEFTTDSDDSDVKYSFPEPGSKNLERKIKRQVPAVKRKSLVGIAKRKSLGKTITPKPKQKKRTAEVEHRCDCGKLFSSAALLSRHTTLDHTPPRIRRRRSPPPDSDGPTDIKPSSTNRTDTKPTSTNHTNTKPTSTKPTSSNHTNNKLTSTKHTKTKPKSDVTKLNKTIGVSTRKSSVSNETKQSDTGKSAKVKSDSFKSLRSAKSLPASDKMKKFEKKK